MSDQMVNGQLYRPGIDVDPRVMTPFGKWLGLGMTNKPGVTTPKMGMPMPAPVPTLPSTPLAKPPGYQGGTTNVSDLMTAHYQDGTENVSAAGTNPVSAFIKTAAPVFQGDPNRPTTFTGSMPSTINSALAQSLPVLGAAPSPVLPLPAPPQVRPNPSSSVIASAASPAESKNPPSPIHGRPMLSPQLVDAIHSMTPLDMQELASTFQPRVSPVDQAAYEDLSLAYGQRQKDLEAAAAQTDPKKQAAMETQAHRDYSNRMEQHWRQYQLQIMQGGMPPVQ